MTNTSDAELLAAVRSAIASEHIVPPADLLDRVLADRARGVRTLLPSAASAPRPHHTRRVALIAAALLAAASVLLVAARRSASSREDGDVFVSSGALISVAEAQELPARVEPASPPFTQIRGERLHAGHFAYAQRWTNASGRDTVDSRGAFEVAATTLNGNPAWRTISVWTGAIGAHETHTESETLYIARGDLRLLRREVHASPYKRYSRINISQHFRGDSVVGQMTAEEQGVVTARRPIAQKLAVQFAPYLTETLAPLMLTTADLGPGWRHSVSLLGWAVRSTDVFSSVDLRVVGEDTVRVPAGTFACWRLELHTGTHVIGYWVRKSDGVGVRTRDESRRATKGVRDVELVREY